MPIKMKKKEDMPQPKGGDKTPKFKLEGDYVCIIKDTRLIPENDKYGESYYYDLIIETGPEGILEERHICKYPSDAKGFKNHATGQVVSAKQAREKDEKTVQLWTSACYGADWDAEDTDAAQELFDAAFREFGTDEKREVSPLAGRRVLVRVKAKPKDDGSKFYNAEIFPYKGKLGKSTAVPTPVKPASKDEETEEAPKKSAPAPEAKKELPPPPAKELTKVAFETAALSAGFKPYPGMPEYMLRLDQDGEPVETVETADVKRKLGY